MKSEKCIEAEGRSPLTKWWKLGLFLAALIAVLAIAIWHVSPPDWVWMTAGVAAAALVLVLVTVYHLDHAHKMQMAHFLYTDPVTGGNNLNAFEQRYRKLAATMNPGIHTIVLLDVSRFKMVNERYGRQTGNQILTYLYRVLERHLHGGEEFAARSESDHFFLCLNESNQRSVCERLDEIVRDINSFRETDLPGTVMTFRMGAYVVKEPQQDLTILLDRARLAAQHMDPDRQRQCVFFDDSMLARLRTEEELNELFDSSIENHDFQVYLQPKIGLAGNRVEGAEALVRWIHPEKGIIFPLDFIPLFERNGKICTLERYIFTEVCQIISRWRREGLPMIPVSVNLTRQHFGDSKFLAGFQEIAERFRIPAGMIEFELTESIFLDSARIKLVSESIQAMHSMGFSCSLDDFGSGFSSLGLLKEFDVDTIKLDRSFFLNLSNPKAKDIIACLVELAKRLKVKTVAEGIEEIEQEEYLRAVGCDMIQGYIFSKPLPVPEFEAWCARWNRAQDRKKP